MDKITFVLPETDEEVEFFVLEQTTLGGKNYLLVADDDGEEAEALILREDELCEDGEVIYEIVDDDDELESVAIVFEELLEDVDFEKEF